MKVQRGPITDHLGEGPKTRVWTEEDGHRYRNRARCTCKHGKEWAEGDLFEDAGGNACRECFEEATFTWLKEDSFTWLKEDS